ncbi:hypothetical protein [Nocardia sp. CY41]|uniref:hypothetical protein n=1 Tax=Nocardia sp. CY41 TaxID=2608686 RepID=UPI0019162157|nr:hypothetical protein [Nocardia sp. CY41]
MTTIENRPARTSFVAGALSAQAVAHHGRGESSTIPPVLHPAAHQRSPRPAIGNVHAVVREGERDQLYRVLWWDAEGNALIANPAGWLEIAANRPGFLRLEGRPPPPAE